MTKIEIKDWNNPSTEIGLMMGNEPDDLYISCISYEPRTTGVLEIIDAQYRANTGIFIVNDRSKHVEDNIRQVRSLLYFKPIFSDISIRDYSIDNPIGIIIKIDGIIKEKFFHKTKYKYNFRHDYVSENRIIEFALLYSSSS